MRHTFRHLSLFQKLFLSLLITSVVLLSGMAIVINFSFKKGLQDYINQDEVAKVELIASQLSSYYSEAYGWQRMKESPHIWSSLLRQYGEAPPPRLPRRPPPGKSHHTQFQHTQAELEKHTSFIPLSARLQLRDISDRRVLGDPKLDSVDLCDTTLVPVMYRDQLVGNIVILQSKQTPNELAEAFLDAQLKNVVMIVVAALIVTLLVASIFVGYLLKPLQALNIGAKKVSQGDLTYRIPQHSEDELGQLIDTFNRLSETLGQQKQIREQWISDISHELRTPLAVLRGEIEAIEDGIRQPNQDNIRSLHGQVMTLAKLVEDLHQLALSDVNTLVEQEFIEFQLDDLLNEVAHRFTNRFDTKQLSLQVEMPAPISFWGDQDAISRLITNLLENSYRYTNEQGVVKVSGVESEDVVRIIVEDSAPSVPNEALPRLFERLYRVDKSRSRASGGSGLGLSICENIVKAHNGTITATHSELGGITVTVTLPNNKEIA
ncbi:ATP-binding protein [Vibrio astriarenae]